MAYRKPEQAKWCFDTSHKDSTGNYALPAYGPDSSFYHVCSASDLRLQQKPQHIIWSSGSYPNSSRTRVANLSRSQKGPTAPLNVLASVARINAVSLQPSVVSSLDTSLGRSSGSTARVFFTMSACSGVVYVTVLVKTKGLSLPVSSVPTPSAAAAILGELADARCYFTSSTRKGPTPLARISGRLCLESCCWEALGER